MTYLATQFGGGIDPLQNFDVASIPVSVRFGRFAARLFAHDAAGRPVIAQDSVGDVRNAIFWEPGSRAIGAWSHATPVRGGSPVNATGGNFSDPKLVAKEGGAGGPGAQGGAGSGPKAGDGLTWKKIGGQWFFFDKGRNTWSSGMATVGGGWGSQFGLNSTSELRIRFGQDNSQTGWSWQYPAINNIGASVGGKSSVKVAVAPGLIGAQGQGGAAGAVGPVGAVRQGARAITGPSGPTFTSVPIRGEYQGDGTLTPKTIALPAGFPSLAGGSVGTVIGGTEHLYEAPVYLHGDPRLVSVNEGPDPSASSVVLDTDSQGNLNPGLSAPLHTAWRVVDPIGTRTATGARGTLAWQLARGERDGTAGYGAIVDTSVRGAGAPKSPTTISEQGAGGTVAGEPYKPASYAPGNPGAYWNGVRMYTPKADQAAAPAAAGATKDDTPALCVALTSARVGGPLEVGHGASDKHRIGDSGSRSVNVAHLSTYAPFFQTATRDAPLDFEPTNYPIVDNYPLRAESHIQYAADRTHAIPGRAGIPGLWRVWSEVPYYDDGGFRVRKGKTPPVTPPSDPPPPPPSEPPPSTPTDPKPDRPVTRPPTGGKPPTTGGREPTDPPPGGGEGGGQAGASGSGSVVGGRGTPRLKDYDGTFDTSGDGATGTTPTGDGHDWGWPGSTPAPMVQPRSPGGKTDKIVVHPTVEAYTAVTFKPQSTDAYALDVRGGRIAANDTRKAGQETPTTLRLEAYGAQIAGVWTRTQNKGAGRYTGGTGPGGVVYLPPEADIMDVDRTGWTPTKSTAYVGAFPGVYFAVGLPLTSTGGWKTGTRWGADTSGNSVFSAMSSAGVATPALTIDTTGGVTLGAKFALAGVLSPAQIVAGVNDYNPTGLSGASILRLSSDANRAISGLAGGTDDRMLVVSNVGSYPIRLLDQSAASSAANRFALGGTLWLEANQSAWLTYDNTTARWRSIGRSANTGTADVVGVLRSAVTTADQLAIGSAFADVTGLTFDLSANATYRFDFMIQANADAVSTGIDVAVNGPTAPTSITYTAELWSAATVMNHRSAVAYDTDTASASSPGTAIQVYRVSGVIVNGANAGTLAARIKREAVGSGPNVYTGSCGTCLRVA